MGDEEASFDPARMVIEAFKNANITVAVPPESKVTMTARKPEEPYDPKPLERIFKISADLAYAIAELEAKSGFHPTNVAPEAGYGIVARPLTELPSLKTQGATLVIDRDWETSTACVAILRHSDPEHTMFLNLTFDEMLWIRNNLYC